MFFTRFVRKTFLIRSKSKINVDFSHRDARPLSQYINGCVVSIRVRGHKIALWLAEAQDSTVVREIGRRWKTMMNLPSTTRIQFEAHNESGNGPAKAMYEE